MTGRIVPPSYDSFTARIVAEIGINHMGRMEVALELVREAAKAGCWGVKFQYRNLESVYGGQVREIGDEIVTKNISRSYLSPDQIVEISRIAQKAGLAVGISFFNADDSGDFRLADFDFFKVPSAEFTNFPLTKALLETGKEVLVSTGMQTEATISRFSERFSGTDSILLLHCVSNYPTAAHNAKLGYIRWLRENYGFRVGYSSHDADWETCLHALQFFPEVIERHITLDKELEGTDHSSSSTPQEFARLADQCNFYSAVTSGFEPRSPNQGELINRQNLGRGFVANSRVEAGQPLTVGEFSYRSPLVGLDHLEFSDCLGRPLVIPVESGEALTLRHLGLSNAELESIVRKWASSFNVGIPVRLHDLEAVRQEFDLGRYELHLSFGEVGRLKDFSGGRPNEFVHIHLPDYCDADSLLDPFSSDELVRRKSLDLIYQVRDFGLRLYRRTGNPPVVVCSFSGESLEKPHFYQAIQSLFLKLSSEAVSFSLQWLPPYAWYFGGSVALNRVNTLFDARLISELEIPVTLDVSHLFLGENSGKYNGREVFQLLSQNIAHIHLSGALGSDGEGVEMNFENEEQALLVGDILSFASRENVTVILESWQGHLDGFSGFKSDIGLLYRRYGAGNA